MKRKSILLVLLCLLSVRTALAQVNMQVFYDFGSDRKYVTMTLEMFKADKWGNTYFFIDHDFNYKQHDSNADNGVAPGGTYLEISRCLNFWQNTKLAPLSLQVEYDRWYHPQLPHQHGMAGWCRLFCARPNVSQHA